MYDLFIPIIVIILLIFLFSLYKKNHDLRSDSQSMMCMQAYMERIFLENLLSILIMQEDRSQTIIKLTQLTKAYLGLEEVLMYDPVADKLLTNNIDHINNAEIIKHIIRLNIDSTNHNYKNLGIKDVYLDDFNMYIVEINEESIAVFLQKPNVKMSNSDKLLLASGITKIFTLACSKGYT